MNLEEVSDGAREYYQELQRARFRERMGKTGLRPDDVKPKYKDLFSSEVEEILLVAEAGTSGDVSKRWSFLRRFLFPTPREINIPEINQFLYASEEFHSLQQRVSTTGIDEERFGSYFNSPKKFSKLQD